MQISVLTWAPLRGESSGGHVWKRPMNPVLQSNNQRKEKQIHYFSSIPTLSHSHSYTQNLHPWAALCRNPQKLYPGLVRTTLDQISQVIFRQLQQTETNERAKKSNNTLIRQDQTVMFAEEFWNGALCKLPLKQKPRLNNTASRLH